MKALQSTARQRQGLLWETSLLDADEGIRFRGYSIPELQARHTSPISHSTLALNAVTTQSANLMTK